MVALQACIASLLDGGGRNSHEQKVDLVRHHDMNTKTSKMLQHEMGLGHLLPWENFAIMGVTGALFMHLRPEL